MKTVLIILISYLFGSIPWALVIGKVFYHKDIRQFGSGNLGASNAGRVLGKHVAGVEVLPPFRIKRCKLGLNVFFGLGVQNLFQMQHEAPRIVVAYAPIITQQKAKSESLRAWRYG